MRAATAWAVGKKGHDCFRIFTLATMLLLSGSCVTFAGEAASSKAQLPRLFPDYTSITFPPNIAPLNFQVQESGSQYRVELRSSKGEPIMISSRSGSIRIPPRAWRALVRRNAGEELHLSISVRDTQSSWTTFTTVTNHIAREEIDSYLAYRLLKPLYNAYVHLGIYQRNLETFEQRPVLENDEFNGGCLNCHTPLNRRPDLFAFNTRGAAKEQPMILVTTNEIFHVDKTMGYLSWHPSGRLLAFSANKLSLFSHTRGETRDVYDEASNLGIYRLDANTVVFPSAIAKPERNETWPGWSADGRYLYFSSALPQPLEKFRRIQYDLMRVSYELESDRWGEPEVVVSSQETGLSACQPKASPDGKWLLFAMCKNGNFPIYQSSSDLYLLDLNTRKYLRLEINSDQADSWHSWSSNSRWVVFSSKRIDGLFARPHFTYVDPQGEFHKPFVLPQEDPAFYDSFLKTFNVPELMQGPVTVTQRQLAGAILKPRKVLAPKITGVPTATETMPAKGESQMRE